MILIALALAATEAARYADCIGRARTDPIAAVAAASAWRADGGGVPARHCLGLALAGNGQAEAAAEAFAGAAQAAEVARSPLAPELWGQAGNALLLAGKTAEAHARLTTALAGAGTGPRAGALLIDRARASVELGRMAEARADLARAVTLAPDDPDGWLLSATLARGAGDLAAAERLALEAARRAPADAAVRLEAGEIALAQGRTELARAAFTAVAEAAPETPAGRRAAAALKGME